MALFSPLTKKRLKVLCGRLTRLHRVDVINALLHKVKGTDYLEVGVRKGETIAGVFCQRRHGVDPVLQLDKISPASLAPRLEDATFFEITSDEFFSVNSLKFDVVLVDGLHQYEQAIKDILNALNCLKGNGYIVVHDCSPPTEAAAAREQGSGAWCGDTWKTMYDLHANYPTIDSFVLDGDYGLGIVSKQNREERFEPRYNEEIVGLPFSFYQEHKEEFQKLRDLAFFRDWLKKI
jgi:hypothetical protein